MTVKPQYITSNSGKKTAVIIPIKEYERLLEEWEDMEDVKLYDASKSKNETSLDINIAFKKLDAKRKSR